MQLTLKDRIIILNGVLPRYDTRVHIKLVKSIKEKIILSDSESAEVVYTNVGNNQYDISFKTVEAIMEECEFTFSDDEMSYLRGLVDRIDQNGMFSEDTMPTYDKIYSEDSNEPEVEEVENGNNTEEE